MMNWFNKNRIIEIFALLFVILFVVILFNSDQGESINLNESDLTENPQTKSPKKSTTSPQVAEAIAILKETIDTKHQYVDGEHTFLGSFQIPNPCYNYNTKITDDADFKVINIEYVKPIDSYVCPSYEPVQRGFVVIFKGPVDQTLKAFINSEEVDLNIIEVPEDQEISSF